MHTKKKYTQKINSEPNDLDTIYKALKKAGEMSAAAEKSGTPMDIPVVNINVPDYPDREPRSSASGATMRGPLMKSLAPQHKPGLSAPMTDISCSGPNFFFIKKIIHLMHTTKKSFLLTLFFIDSFLCFLSLPRPLFFSFVHSHVGTFFLVQYVHITCKKIPFFF